MATAKLDAMTLAHVRQLYDSGKGYKKISKETGIPVSTVRDLIKRGDGSPAESSPAPASAPAHTPATEEAEGADWGAEQGVDEDESRTLPSTLPEFDESPITREEATKNIRAVYSLAKQGYYNARSATDDKSSLLAQAKFLSVMKDATRQMISVTGLDKVEAKPVDVSPLDALADALKDEMAAREDA